MHLLFAVFCIIAGILAGTPAFRGNVFRGVGAALICAFLLPTWPTDSWFGITSDYRVIVAIVALAVATTLHARWIFDRITITDFIVLSLCFWQTLSEWNQSGRIVIPLALSYGFWVLPYLAGRCSIRTSADFKLLGVLVAMVCLVFGAVAAVETVTGLDLFEFAFGRKPGLSLHTQKGVRWGFTRIEGPFQHGIFFGVVSMLLLPWTVWLLLTKGGKRRGLGALASLFAIVATVSTISRGPVLGVVVTLIVAALIPYRRTFAALVTLVAVLLIALVAKPDWLEPVAMRFAELSGEHERIVAIGDEVQIKNSSMSRLLILQHYRKAMLEAGVLGYGMTATNTFPPNVPHVPFDQVTRKQFAVVDNSYVLLTLRGGWLECFGFVLLHLAALYQLSGLGQRHSTLVSLCRLLSGAICAHAFVVFTVYPDYDFMFVFLWTVGISSIRLQADESEKLGRVSGEPSIAK